MTDAAGRPHVLLLSPGNVNDIVMASALLARAGRLRCLIADKGYDAGHLRQELAARNIKAVIPSTASRRAPIPYDKAIYRRRNHIERMFCRLKDFRRIATRYDKLARNFLAGALLAAIVIWWIN